MKAEGLKKGMFFNPDPYVKMSVHPGKKRKSRRFQSRHVYGEQHQRTSVRENTCMPVWNREVKTLLLLADLIQKFIKLLDFYRSGEIR